MDAIRYDEEVCAFFESDSQRVLLLQGLWGTGKTYFWKHLVQRERSRIDERFYSYVSLFGSSSVSHVKSLVMFGGKALRETEDVGDALQRAKTWLARRRRYFGALKLPYVGDIGSILPTFEELLIRDYLVCFDDLERRNRSLDLEQFFGFVSVLKEQNNCRVVIICNEQELSARDRRILTKYREKIVDRQITYAPRFADNFRLIFPTPDENIEQVFRSIELNNIRVFQQTLWCLRYFEPHIADRHPAFVQTFRQQCAKLSCVHYALSKHLTFEQMRSMHWLFAGWERRAEVQDESSRLIEQLEFSSTDADEFIIRYLRDGYCDLAALGAVVTKMDPQYRRSEGEEALRAVWALYRDSFRADATRIRDAALGWFAKYHTLVQFDSTKYLLQFVAEIDSSFDPQPYIDQTALALVADADASTLATIEKDSQVPEVQFAIAMRREQIVESRSLEEVILSLGHPDGWNPADFAQFDAYTDEALYDWLAKADGTSLLGQIARVMVRAQLQASDSRPDVADKLRRVVTRLAERSPLDRARAEKFIFHLERKYRTEHGLPDVTPRAADELAS
ncbi:MAG: hypothetical protein H0T95_10210 [Chthoniobacterales bacterium]|nr:hypothetical protein [Chthoniobacterales bacterium]